MSRKGHVISHRHSRVWGAHPAEVPYCPPANLNSWRSVIQEGAVASTATFVLPVHLKVLIISTSGDTSASLVHPIVRNCTRTCGIRSASLRRAKTGNYSRLTIAWPSSSVTTQGQKSVRKCN